ncbi:MAG: TonB-dependent receptor plug domain-containing protein [Daejeonella sp.]|nr:TonB-dependent receptor plug domain-containing protein [Daejeonella sp.]
MMPELIIYLLKVNLSILLFYFGYRLFLKQFTFYSLNRIYLLLGLIYSSLYPLINIADLFKSSPEIKQQISNLSPDWQYSATYVNSTSPDPVSIYWQVVILIFWTGVILMLARLIIQLISLLILHRKSESAISGNYSFRIVSKKVNPFSFWKTIYLNPEYHEQKELQSILEHEQVHVRQLHSLDVLFAEICTIFCWFNPGVWLIKDAIQANLEFITDLQVLNSGIDSKEYQYALLKINVLPQNALPVNNFHLLTIKKRIAMMNKRQSNQIKKGIYILLLPAIMCLVLIVSNSKAALNGCQLGSVIANLPQMPKIIGINSELTAEGIKSSESVVIQNKNQLIINSEVSIPADTTKTKTVLVKFSAISDSLNTGHKKTLYVIDGIANSNPATLNPENIAKITVLKGTAGTVQYGASGINGVIEITTKTSGKSALPDAQPSTTISLRQVQSEKVSLGGLNNNELILLNGNEVEKSALNDLSVMSIAAIEVFKGEKALNKFGEKGRNGVIVITTKPE